MVALPAMRLGVPRRLERAVPRPRLAQAFQHPSPVVVAAAPHGSGVSSAVSQWVHDHVSHSTLVIWVDLDLVPTVVAVQQRIVEGFTGELVAADKAALSLERELHANTLDVVVVLDHLPLDRPDLMELATSLTLRSSRVRIVLCSFSEPDLWLVGARVDHHVVTAENLLFDLAETSDLLASYDVPRHHAAGLLLLTGGWALWTHVAAMMLARAAEEPGEARLGAATPAFRQALGQAMHNHLLAHLSEEAVAWLRLMAGLSEFDEAGMIQLTGAAGLEQLAALRHSGHVVSAGDRWRTHPLVRLAMRTVPQECGGGTGDEAATRALVALARERGEVFTAFREALTLTEDDLLIELVLESWLEMLRDAELAAAVFDRLPAEAFRAHVQLRVAREWFGLWRTRSMVLDKEGDGPVLGRTEGMPAPDDGVGNLMVTMIDRRLAADLEGAAAAAGALLNDVDALEQRDVQNDRLSVAPIAMVQAATTHALTLEWTSALPVLMKAHRSQAADMTGIAARAVRCNVALLLALTGDIRSAHVWSDQELAGSSGGVWLDHRTATSGRLARTWLAMEALDPVTAEAQLVPLRAQRGTDEMWPYIVEAQITYELLWGDPEAALLALERARQEFDRWLGQPSYAGAVLNRLEVDLRLACGHGDAVPPLLEGLPPQHPWRITRQARLDVLQGHVEAALTLRLPANSRTARDRVELDLAQTMALTVRGDLEAARDRARRVAAALRRSRMRLPLTQVRATSRVRLAEMSPDLARVLEPIGGQLPLSSPERLSLVDLTDRERAILDALAAGLKREDAARQLFVSVNTVKTQIASLYRKLEVSDRGELLTRATVLGLI